MKLVYNGCLYESQPIENRNTYEYLSRKYLDKPVYITFHNIEKIGIHPGTAWSTPNGIYCYQIDHFFEQSGDVEYKGTKYDNDGKVIENQNAAKYVSVLEAKKDRNILKLRNMTDSDVNSYANELIGILRALNNKAGTTNTHDNFDRLISSEGILDKIKFLANTESKSKTPGGIFWIITLYCSILYASISKGKQYEVLHEILDNKTNVHTLLYMIRPVNHWNRIFTLLNIDGVRDDGQGIIHHNEPTQTVFFDINSFKVLETINYNENRTANQNSLLRYLIDNNKMNKIPSIIRNGQLDLYYVLGIGEDYYLPLKHRLGKVKFNDKETSIMKSLISHISENNMINLSPMIMIYFTGHDVEIGKKILNMLPNTNQQFNNELKEFIITNIASQLKNDELYYELTDEEPPEYGVELLAKKGISYTIFGNWDISNLVPDETVERVINSLGLRPKLEADLVEIKARLERKKRL